MDDSQSNDEIIPSAVGDIHIPRGNSKIPFDMNFSFNPNTPVTLSSPEGYGKSTDEAGLEQSKPGFFKTAGAEAFEFSSLAKLIHAPAASDSLLAKEFPSQVEPLNEVVPDGWSPNTQPEMFYDINPQYMPYLMDSKGPKDLQYRRERVMSEQEHDETLANGSMFARIIGGFAGAVTDPTSYIPIAGWVKYAKFAPTILKSAARAVPGMTAAGVIQSGANELDRVNGNLHDFVVNSAIDSVFASSIFGGIGGVALALDKMEMLSLKDLASSWVKGVDFQHIMDESGKVTGIKAIDTTGNLGAKELDYAQQLADSSFNKSGFFKLPYIGDAALWLKGYPGIGSPLLNGLNSTYDTIKGFFDRAADHTIITKGLAEGGVRAPSFEFLMKREFANLRSIATQMNALHLQRMGMDLKFRPLADATQVGLGLYNKSLKLLGQDLDKTGYISREQFNDEIQRVLYSGESSEHAAVNEGASLAREQYNRIAQNYLKAYNLPEDYLSNMEKYLSRVYDTEYMNTHKEGAGGWVPTIANWLKESDAMITGRMQPIRDLESQIQNAKEAHAELIKQPGINDKVVKQSSDKIEKLQRDLKIQNENLQNELRTNPEYDYHIEDRFALSADEAKELTRILKPLNDLKSKADAQQKIVSALKSAKAKSKQSAIKGKTAETAKKHVSEETANTAKVKIEEEKLNELNRQIEDKQYELYSSARNGEINPRFFNSITHEFKDPSNRLKFRDVYGSDIERQNAAKAYYDSIMHLKPEDIINDVMGKITGNAKENPLKARTLLVPDELLYNNNFMTKDLMAKLYNYTLYLSRKTHLKNVFQDVTHDGGIEPLIERLGDEYKSKRAPFDNRKTEIANEIKNIDEKIRAGNLSGKEIEKLNSQKEDLQAQDKKLDKNIKAEAKRFDAAKTLMQKAYEKMMGNSNRGMGERMIRSGIMSFTAMANLHFLPPTQLADLGSIGLQHGVWPFVRDAVYPVLQSLGGILKTKDSEALRKTAPSVDLALQDQIGGYADKNWSMEAQPYLNMGRIVGGIEKLAHFSSNLDLTTYIDNGLQRLAGATIQSEFMRILHDSVVGKMSKKDSEYLRKYGIDPKQWAERMVKAYEDAQGFKTALGGYQSKFWQWQDLEAANVFSDAVFRGIQNTILNRGMFDSPFWADNMLGMIFHTFTGWGYASINRYLVPMLQRPDASQILKVMLSLGFGSLVSPMRRMIRGEDAVPENMSDAQRFWETINDSNIGSALATTLDWANLISGDRLLGDLKNDKYRDRMRIGAFGPVVSTANRMANIFDSLASGEFNQQDANQMARMLPITGSAWGYYMSKMLIDKLELPPTRGAAHAEKS